MFNALTAKLRYSNKMIKRLTFALTLLVLGSALYYFYLRAQPLEGQIRALFTDIVNEVETDNVSPLIEARLKANKLAENLTPKISIHYRSPDEEFERTVSRKEVIDAITASLIRIEYLKVGFSRFSLAQTSIDLIRVSVFVVAEWRIAGGGELARAAEDTVVELRLLDGAWRVSAIETFTRTTL